MRPVSTFFNIQLSNSRVKSEDIYCMYINGGRMTGGYGGRRAEKA